MFFSLRKEKNEKKPQTSGLTICAAGSGSMAAMKDGVHAHFVRVIRQPPPLSQASHRMALTRRAPCACGRGLPSGNYFPHGECWLAEQSESKQLLGAVGMCFSVDRWEFEAVASTALLVSFLPAEKSTYFLL